ncbi:MAG: bifunctional phosphopantothenoylcysteine decarboxylase/phosphopantothenate--cysteine ligase CoaBC [Deltaproteobacteria bacterium]|nr:bifunctional phosphopantothenoylcysteine decarboxylase/phosphopantothenate--cysteine ligase CoaBC [Deltaproteobacteria bacterium]
MTHNPKRVLLGVSGSIAAYKAVEIARLLHKRGVRIQVAMTEVATKFIAPMTFEAVTGRRVLVDLYEVSHGEIEHVERAHEIDLLLIAPATATTISRLATGVADDVISSVALSTRARVMVAPSMETGMWTHPATMANVKRIESFGYLVVGPGTGDLASGRTGVGRMLEPEEIVAAALAELSLAPEARSLEGRTVLVTAGPTYEPIDPVRVLTNRSTGAMGIAIAEAARALGAHVRLVLGPTHLTVGPSIEVTRVETAVEMLNAAAAAFEHADAFVSTAAVSDFRPADPKRQKLKRGATGSDALELTENPDILKTLAWAKRPGQVVVGFAAETEDVEANAEKKRVGKNCDLVVANQVGPDRGFGVGQTSVIFVGEGSRQTMGPADKPSIARALMSRVGELLASKSPTKA